MIVIKSILKKSLCIAIELKIDNNEDCFKIRNEVKVKVTQQL